MNFQDSRITHRAVLTPDGRQVPGIGKEQPVVRVPVPVQPERRQDTSLASRGVYQQSAPMEIPRPQPDIQSRIPLSQQGRGFTRETQRRADVPLSQQNQLGRRGN